MFFRTKYIITEALAKSLKQHSIDLTQEEISNSIGIAKLEFADLYSNIFFKKEIIKNKNIDSIIEAVQTDLPDFQLEIRNGYLNITFNDRILSRFLVDSTFYQTNKPKNFIIEFPSVNPNKPWHIGHLRNALLGQSIATLLQKTGHNVFVIDYIDDLGLQFAQTIYGLMQKNLLNEFTEQELSKLKMNYGRIDFFLGNTYVEIAGKIGEDSEEVKDIVRKMEHDRDFLKKSRKIAEICVSEQYITAEKYGITRDLLVFESDVVSFLRETGVNKLKASQSIRLIKDQNDPYNNCYVIDVSHLPESKEGKKVLIRSDGTLTYTGKDIIFHMWKYGLIPDNMKYTLFERDIPMTCFYSDHNLPIMKPHTSDCGIVIIGLEQTYPQKILKFCLEQLNCNTKHIHVGYAHVKLRESRFSGRKGTWLGYTAEELLEECIEREAEKLTDKKPNWQEIAETISTAAIKYYILKHSPEREIVFEWDKALSLEGNAAPYLLYTCVRANAIFKKAQLEMSKYFSAPGSNYTFNQDEKKLLRLLIRYPAILEEAERGLYVHNLTDYAFEIASAFNTFYNRNQVLVEDSTTKEKRLLLCKKYYSTMEHLLSILGITIPEWM